MSEWFVENKYFYTNDLRPYSCPMFMTKGKVMSGNREKLYSQVQYKTENRKEKF